MFNDIFHTSEGKDNYIGLDFHFMETQGRGGGGSTLEN